jgi:hydroxyethylthiazole kinase
MLKAGKKANQKGIPIVLDPVGAGATSYRTETVQCLLKELKIAVIKGNAGEIATLAGEEAEVRGVESGEVEGVDRPARFLSETTGAVVAVTGEKDLVALKDRLEWIGGGSPRMKTFVGSGCVAASIIGCFVGANPDEPFEAAVAALTFYRKAAERAAAKNPPGAIAFRDLLYAELWQTAPEDL